MTNYFIFGFKATREKEFEPYNASDYFLSGIYHGGILGWLDNNNKEKLDIKIKLHKLLGNDIDVAKSIHISTFRNPQTRQIGFIKFHGSSRMNLQGDKMYIKDLIDRFVNEVKVNETKYFPEPVEQYFIWHKE